MQDPIGKILELLLGINVPLVSITVPPLAVSVLVSWDFPIYPPVWLTVGFSAGFAVSIFYCYKLKSLNAT